MAERFRITAALADAGIDIKRQNLRRQNPEATEAEIDALLRTWLRRRPLDAPGRPVSFEEWVAHRRRLR